MKGFHVHDLRHTGNTLAAATGASTKELMARMGHASAEAALRYQHATARRDAAIADALDQMVGGTRLHEGGIGAWPPETRHRVVDPSWGRS